MRFPLSLVCIKGHHVNSIFDEEKKIDQFCPPKVYDNVNIFHLVSSLTRERYYQQSKKKINIHI